MSNITDNHGTPAPHQVLSTLIYYLFLTKPGHLHQIKEVYARSLGTVHLIFWGGGAGTYVWARNFFSDNI